jgi:hypothetical protein
MILRFDQSPHELKLLLEGFVFGVQFSIDELQL